jgi:hypothetical protein
LLELSQRPATPVEIARPRIGQRDRSGGAVEQARRQAILERRHGARDGSRRAMQPPRRLDEARFFGDRDKDRQCVQAVHDYSIF